MYTALVADDEDHVRETIKVIVEWQTLQITRILEATDGETAYELILKEQPDIAIVDMKMPYMDGAELLRKCAGKEVNTKFIIASGYDDFEYTRQAIRSGIVDYILKPIDPLELNEAVKKAVAAIRPVMNVAAADALANSAEAGPADFTAAIKEFIEKNYAGEISLDMFAKKFFMTKEYILKKFKDVYGFGIYEYVMKVRMERARQMLAVSGSRIQEIADQTGFNDSNYFSKAFKKYYGLSPREFRESKRIAVKDNP